MEHPQTTFEDLKPTPEAQAILDELALVPTDNLGKTQHSQLFQWSRQMRTALTAMAKYPISSIENGNTRHNRRILLEVLREQNLGLWTAIGDSDQTFEEPKLLLELGRRMVALFADIDNRKHAPVVPKEEKVVNILRGMTSVDVGDVPNLAHKVALLVKAADKLASLPLPKQGLGGYDEHMARQNAHDELKGLVMEVQSAALTWAVYSETLHRGLWEAVQHLKRYAS